MKDSHHVMEQAEKICLTRGKQLTAKRKLVLSALLHANKPLSAYELVDYCHQHFAQNIQAMSVYRILDFLEAEHFAHKLNVSSKYIACSHILYGQEHGVAQFLICSCCDKVNEVTMEDNVISRMRHHAKQEGFTVITPQVELNCLCDDCSKNNA